MSYVTFEKGDGDGVVDEENLKLTRHKQSPLFLAASASASPSIHFLATASTTITLAPAILVCLP